MALRIFQYSFNAGELSPDFDGRADHARYFAGLKICENYITLPLGGADGRWGLLFIASQKDETRKARLVRFEFSITQAYMLEMGHEYIRFYFASGGRIEDPPGTPVEVLSPYQEDELFALQFTQSADVMWITHPNHAQHKLLRFSNTQWSLQIIPFDPPPSVEEPVVMGVDLTLNALTGTGVTFTAASPVFFDGDVGRQLSLVPSEGSLARAVITALNGAAPTASITVNILTDFPSSPALANTWRLEGPLGVGLQPKKFEGQTGIKGTSIKALLIQREIFAAELLSNGAFGSGLTSWTDHSAAAITSGTHTGGNNSADLQDTTKHFPALGVGVGYRVVNTTDGSNGNITTVRPGGNALALTLAGGAENDFDTGDAYQIFGNGGAVAANGGAQLSAGPGGHGWLEQAITTVNGQTYRVLFDVAEAPLSVQIGSSSKGSDLYPEASFAIGKEHEALFTATSATSYVQFRNNQPTMSRVSNVSAKNISALGFRNEDVGKFLKVQNGVLEILSLDNAHSANVLVRAELDFAEVYPYAVAGSWRLEVAAWSDTRGYPRASSFHQQRLGFGGTLLQPLTAWQSETGEYERFGASALADSSLEQEFSANQLNPILWMEPFRDLLVGTAAGEHLLRGVNGPLTPTNGEQLPQTTVGSEGLPPIRVHNALIILERGARQIKELLIDDVGQSTQGPDHTLLADHITESGIVQWAMQKKPLAILWAVRADGVLIGLTYEQFEQVRGWHRHTTDGAIESVCVMPIPSPTSKYTEEVWVSVRRTIDGQTRRAIERFTPGLHLDSAVRYSGSATTTIGGLEHLEGKTVKVVDRSSGKAAVLPDVVVTGGTITLGTSVTAADVGLGYTARLQTMRPEANLRDGTLQGRKKRWLKIMARLRESVGLTINGKAVPFRRVSDPMDEGLPPQDIDAELTGFGWDKHGYITIEQTQPLPSTVLAIVGELEIEESQ